MPNPAPSPRRRGLRWPALLGLPALASALLAAPGKPAPPAGGVAVATLVYADKVVEKESTAAGWRKLQEGERFRTGDRVRVGIDALARFEFPWMSLTAGPATTLHIPAERILSTVLDEGRAELLAPGQQIVKVRTADAEIRGEGRVVVRRERQMALVVVMAIDGSASVEARSKTAILRAGEGTVIEDGNPPGEVTKLAPAPAGLWPGQDPVYVKKGLDVRLNWSPKGTAHHLQILPIDTSDPLIARDVGPPPYAISIPWLGTYRWRVATRDEKGLEGLPSAFGYICVVDK